MKKVFFFLVAVYVIMHFLLSVLFGVLIGNILCLLGMSKTGKRYIRFHGVLLARGIVWALGGKVTVIGLENLPKNENRLCFISNHRSQVDIPLAVGHIPVPLGFIAKKELSRIPILRTWMEVLGCVYIDRTSPRSQVKAILDGVDAIRNGRPQLIFPEGTRSGKEEFGHFKEGSIKLATRSKALIVPITIKNTSLLMEARTSLRPQPVELFIHPPIDSGSLTAEELKELPDQIFDLIRSR